VNTDGGDVDVGVCYCDALQLDSAGGDISLSHMNCQGPQSVILVKSHGGGISIGGLDGSAVIDAGSGHVTLQVRKRLRPAPAMQSLLFLVMRVV
jgi:hypothetical protein